MSTLSQTSLSLVSVVIPTYGREAVLIQTISQLLLLSHQAHEVLIIDQSPRHEVETETKLKAWHDQQRINWIRLELPSITKSMNYGLQVAKSDLVLFLDDDITLNGELVLEHAQSHVTGEYAAVVGQVLQPEQLPMALHAECPRTGFYADLAFPFHSTIADDVQNVMAGNLSVNKHLALAIGGFDENFQGSAYRFETDFARRLHKAGHKIKYSPTASINHLRAERGGTRQQGNHLTSADPRHSVGDYYLALKQPWSLEKLYYILKRPFREVCTKFHLTHPWYIPVKLLGEIRGLCAALTLLK